MGYSGYRGSVLNARLSDAKSKGTDVFTHTASVHSGKTAAASHAKLDPKKLNAVGKNVRESFDSDAHPDSVAVGVIFDVTGSMGSVPRLAIENLNKLMGFLVKKGYLKDPHILFGFAGDATCDRVPIQMGQFESGNEMDEALSLAYIESGGGGSHQESYELCMYYLARHTDIDCYNKRGKKGYIFFFGDETPYEQVKKSQVAQFIGDTLEADIPTEQILTELRERYEVFWVMPSGTSHANDKDIIKTMRDMFGQNYLTLDHIEDVCELIASTIGVAEGYDLHDIASGLRDIGADSGAVDRTSTALASYVASTGLVGKGAVASGALPATTDGDAVSRL